MSEECDINKREYPSAKDLISSGLMLDSSSDFDELIRLMYQHRTSACIISQEDSFQEKKNKYYIITRSDIIAFLYNVRIHEKIREDARSTSTVDERPLTNLFKVKLSNLMNGPVEILDEDLSIDLVISYMTEKGFKRVLVGKNGEPSGIINVEDILAWNTQYFKKSNPLMLLVMDNETSIILSRHEFISCDSEHSEIRNEMIDLYGGVLASLNSITEEIFNHSGELRSIRKDNYTIMFEPREKVTGVVVADDNSIYLRRKLHFFVNQFCAKYNELLSRPNYSKMPKMDLDIEDLATKFAV